MISKKLRGNIVLVLIFAMTTFLLCFALFQQTVAISDYSRSNAQRYSDKMSYRAAVELATYQFVTDLEAVSMTQDISTEWLTKPVAQKYADALDTVTEYTIDASTNRWVSTDISNIIVGCGVSDTEMLTNLSAKVLGSEFYIELVDYPALDWSNVDNSIVDDSGKVYLEDLEVHAYLKQKGSVIDENFIIRGLYLEYTLNGTIVSAKISEDLEGVEVLRNV